LVKATKEGTKEVCIAAGVVVNVLVKVIDFAKLVSQLDLQYTFTYLGDEVLKVIVSGNTTAIVVSFIV
jgi:hypothetical protein